MVIKLLMALVFVCSFCDLSYASELLADEAYVHFNEGVRAQISGDYRAAQTSYQRALLMYEETPCRKFILNNSALMYIEQGRTDDAEFCFKQAIRLDPNYDNAVFNLALLYLKLAVHYKQQGDTAKAMEYLDRAFEFHSERSFIMEEEKEVPKPES